MRSVKRIDIDLAIQYKSKLLPFLLEGQTCSSELIYR